MKKKNYALVPFISISVLMIITYLFTIIFDCEGISFIKWILSPILVLFSPSSVTTIAIIIFLIIICVISQLMVDCGFFEYLINKLAMKYQRKKYIFMYILIFILMAMGSLIGSFEEIIPLVPLVVQLSNCLGFDAYIGVSISILAAGTGFACSVANPFTVGIAQNLLNLPLYSGFLYRLLGFIIMYLFLIVFVRNYAKKHEIDNKENINLEIENNKEKAIKAFAICISVALLLTLSSAIFTFIQDYTLIIMGLSFMIGGILAVTYTKTKPKQVFSSIISGIKEALGSIILILMASSIRYTMEISGCLEIITNYLISLVANLNRFELILFIFILFLFLELFISSASAKAFLVIPLIAPIAQNYGISSQLIVLAFAFGDGFTNLIYPTNVGLLISLGLIKMEYKSYLNFIKKYIIAVFILSILMLLFGIVIDY